jgi:biotin carboxylase
MANKRNIIIAVGDFSNKQVASVKSYNDSYKILLLRDKVHQSTDTARKMKVDFIEYVDFSDGDSLERILLKYPDTLGVTARGESGVQELINIIPYVPYLRTPTTESLEWCLDKYSMRRKLKKFCPANNPKFTIVKSGDKADVDRIINKIGFPMIVKPANLEASVLVSICYHRAELEKVLKRIQKKMVGEYNKLRRSQAPRIIAEEFMDGDMYSVDSYVDSRGRITHCPLVKIKTGKYKGHDDFYNYLRVTPVKLKSETINNAQTVASNAIRALGLRSSTAHVELMKLDSDWKVIEVGARLGGFRHELYNLSCGIDHYLNDVLIRIPKPLVLPKKCTAFAAALRYYPDSEGVIKSIVGLKMVKNLESVVRVTQKLKLGDKVVYSKNGGKGVFDIVLKNPDRAHLLADIRRIESGLKVRVT